MSHVIDSSPKVFEIPSEGPHVGTIVSVTYDKNVPNPFGDPKDRVTLKWEVEELDENGEPRSLLDFYNESLHEKSKLRKRITGILGDQGEKYDTDLLVGVKANIVVEHVQRAKKTFANLIAATRFKAPATAKASKPVKLTAAVTPSVTPSVIPPAPVFNEDAEDALDSFAS